MCGSGCRVGIILYVIVQFIAFLCYLVGTPIDMYRARGNDFTGSINNFLDSGCLTLWGYKPKCGSTDYPNSSRTANIYELCTDRKTRFQAAEALAIITLILMLIALILGFIQLCCCRCLRWMCLILNILAFSCGVIPWAIAADSYSNGYGNALAQLTPNCMKFKEAWKYGAGFALLIVGWGLGLISIIFLMLPC